MKNSYWQSIRWSTLLGVLCVSAVFVTLRAAEQPKDAPAAPSAAPVSAAHTPASPGSVPPATTAANPASVRPPAPVSPPPTLASPGSVPPATTPANPAPSAPEESATIRDDPTVAPDPRENADNSVTFPADI